MEKTIEEAYYKAFQQLADDCISYILQKGLKQMQPPELRAAFETTLLFHCSSIEELQKAIPNDFEQFQKANKQSEISKEIESNLDSTTDPKERLKYLFSLLTPFKEICRAIHPKKHTPKEKAEKSSNSWERLERSKQGAFEGVKDLKNTVLSKIAERNKYYELPYTYKPIEKSTIEYYLKALLLNMENYSNRLYAVLIQRGIDLKDIQDMAGIYLKSNWVADDIAPYIGGVELAQYYINSIKPDEQPKQNTPLTAQQLPDGLNTDKAKKYFERAYNNGFWGWVGNNAKWKETQAKLGYFCLNAFDKPRPITQIELFFGVKNLAASITQADYEAKRADVKIWRDEMNRIIFFD